MNATQYALPPMGRKRHEMGSFPSELKALREKAGLTQFEAAVLLELQPQTVSRYERGITVPHPAAQDGLLDRLRAEAKKQARKPKA